MATYALEFNNRSAFNTALASGGSIYSLLNSVTSTNPSVGVVALVKDTNTIFNCGCNIVVDIKSAGPGDAVLYDSTDGKFFAVARKWIYDAYPSAPTQNIITFNPTVLLASVASGRYTYCGTVVKRFGNRIRIAGAPASKVWSNSDTNDYAWNVSGMYPPGQSGSCTQVMKKDGGYTNTFNTNTWCAFPSMRYQEYFFPNGNSSYLPITRSAWNTALAAGNATVTENGKTATLADYDYSYDTFLAKTFAPKYPAPAGAYADTDGLARTAQIVAAYIGKTNQGGTITEYSDSYAAGYCYNYQVSGVPGLGRGRWFLGTLKDAGEIRPMSHTLLTSSGAASGIAWGSGYIWSCTQYSSSYAWYVGSYGYAYSKYGAFYAVPLADLILEP